MHFDLGGVVMKIREFEDIMAFGAGFDAVSGDVKGDCVLRTEPESPTVGQGQDISFFLELITDSAQLAKRLEVSASASLKVGLGGVSKGQICFRAEDQ
jgi:hypothetical protein